MYKKIKLGKRYMWGTLGEGVLNSGGRAKVLNFNAIKILNKTSWGIELGLREPMDSTAHVDTKVKVF